LVRLELGGPKFTLCARQSGYATAFVRMPKTAVHHYCSAILGHHNIWSARQIQNVETKAPAGPMKSLTHKYLRLRMLAPKAGHKLSSLLTFHSRHPLDLG
jgi:hypothetical protein